MMPDLNEPRDAEIGLLTNEVKAPAARPHTHTPNWRNAVFALLIFVGLLAVIFTILHEDQGDFTFLKRARDLPRTPLNVLVVGDWGRRGQYNQSRVATQMGRVAGKLDINFIISTGDNFYDSGLESTDDALFEESFSQIYRVPSLQKPWFAVLGNHDYRGNPEVQVNNGLKRRDSRWHCDYTYTLTVDLELETSCNGASSARYVEFFFIDTNPLEEDYWISENTSYNWTRSTPREEVIANQLKNLTSALEASTATWKVVVGHHTLYSYGHHGNTPELIEKVLPIMNANNVDLYVNGHDHSLQHIKHSESDIHFITSGGGSKAWKGQVAPSNVDDLKLYYDGQGFISMSISPTVLFINYFDVDGKILHQLELKK